MTKKKEKIHFTAFRRFFQSGQVFQGGRTSRRTLAMNKNNLNVGDGKGEAMKIKKKPLRVLEMMKGGIRDRPLASWIRILGWFLSSQNFFTFCCSVVAVLWWTFIIAFMAGCYALMSVDLSLSLDLGMKCPQSGT